jgi:hypothetical protein
VPQPSYSLEVIKQLIAAKQYGITKTALDGAFALGFDKQDICDCICDYLEGTHFYKTMLATDKPSLMQDVYQITYESQYLYLKLQIDTGRAVVVSFKANDRIG